MQSRMTKPLSIYSLYLCALVVWVIGATAQENHPLAGTWRGKWITTEAGADAKGKAGAAENFAVEMKWDNKNVTGTFNPGRFGVPLKVVTLNRADWTVHIEVDIREGHVVADGKLGDIDSGNPTIAGTWTQGSEKGEFTLTRASEAAR